MSPALSRPADLAALKSAVLDGFADAGVAVHVETDLVLRKRRVAAVQDRSWTLGRAQPAFEPEEGAQAFWFDVRPLAVEGGAVTGDAGMMAHAAIRAFPGETLHHLFTDGVMVRPWDGNVAGLAPGASLRDVTGAFAYGGSVWVDRRLRARGLRSRGLAGLLSLLAFVHLLERGDVDGMFGQVKAREVAAGLPQVFRFVHLRECLSIHEAGAPTPAPVWLGWSVREEMVEALRVHAASRSGVSEAA